MTAGRLLLGALGLAAAVLGVLAVRDATLSTHQAAVPGSEVEVVVDARSEGAERGQSLPELVQALVLTCRLEVPADLAGPIRDEGDGQFRFLLAPALEFGGNRMESLGDRGIGEWKRTNRLDVFHYAYGRIMPVHYELYADALRYDGLGAALTLPIQVFQGHRDQAVDPAAVERWCRARPDNVELHLLDDDHQLGGSLEYIWRESSRFLGLA